MTGGRVVILGPTGRNFAAGMSGGIAYVLDEQRQLQANCNTEMVGLGPLDDPAEIEQVLALIRRHAEFTGSQRAHTLLTNWLEWKSLFVKVIPHDYKRVMEAQRLMREKGLSPEDAELAAFQLDAKEMAGAQGK
jgi:glutamate synthase (ferredoxin)